MKLYIVGNGFDCHHNLKTSYNHYREFLSNTYPQMVIDYEKFPYLDILDSPWSDIERALAIDYRSLMENCMGKVCVTKSLVQTDKKGNLKKYYLFLYMI